MDNLIEVAADRDVGVCTAQQVAIDWTDSFDYQKLKKEEIETYSSIEVTEGLHEGGIHAQKAWVDWSQYLARDVWKTSLAEEIVSFCNAIANPRILSLGCGYGGVELGIAPLLKKPYEIIAVDLNGSIFNKAEEEVRTKGFNIRFLSLDLNFIGIRKNAFDLVFAASSLHHLLNLEHVFSQIYRGLRENGRLIVQDIIGKTQVLFWKENIDFAIDLVRNMPPRYKLDSLGEQSIIPPYVEPAIQKGMEGIRQEEIESQINKYFAPIKMFKYGSFIRLICTHPELGKRIDPSNEADREYLETLFRLDLQQIKENKLRPTEMLAVFEKRALVDVSKINSEGRANLRACYSEAIRQKDRRIADLEGELANLGTLLHEKERRITEMQGNITEMQGELSLKEAALYKIHNSHGWKALTTYYRIRDKMFAHDRVMKGPGDILPNSPSHKETVPPLEVKRIATYAACRHHARSSPIMTNGLWYADEDTNLSDFTGNDPPKKLMFSLTGKCNLRCDHCPRGVIEVSAHQTPNELIDYVIRDILPRVRSVQLGGTDLAEQLTSSNFNRFLEAVLARPPKHLEIVSNLTVLDEARADLIARACTDFRISLEGVGAAYERVRHFPWAKIERHLELLMLARMKHAASPLGVCCLVTCFHDNLHDLEAILDLDRLGVARFQFRLFQPTIPEQASQALDYHRSEANAVFDRIRAIADVRHLQVSLPPQFEIAPLVPTAKPATEFPTTRTSDLWVCHFPFETVSVLSDGRVSPCCEAMYLGQLDLQKPDLTAVFRSEPWQNLRRSLATGEFSGRCVTCELRKSRQIEIEKLDPPTL